MRILLLMLFCEGMFFSLSAQNQITVHRHLNWDAELSEVFVSEKEKHLTLDCEGCAADPSKDFLPFYVENISLNQDGEIQITIENAVYEAVGNTELFEQSHLIGEHAEVTYWIGYFKTEPKALISILPLRKNTMTGEVEKLVDFDLKISIQPKSFRTSLSSMTYASNSVLTTGDWYKISVNKTGVFKLDYEFFQDLEIDVSNIDPRNIRVYGNGGGMLPEKNDDPRYDDLQENAIEVFGESDGAFNTSDYVLFYAQSPDEWKYNSSDDRYHHVRNMYSDNTYYYITTDLGAGKRIQSQASEANSNTTAVAFDDFAFHDNDLENLIGSGQDWWGESFDFVNTSENFSFSFPNIQTTVPVYIKSRVAARSTVSNSSFTTLVNGSLILTQSTTPVGAEYTDPYADVDTGEQTFNANTGSFSISVNFSNPSSGATGWLDYIELNARRSFVMNGSQLSFRDNESVGAGNISAFAISNSNSTLKVWDVTHIINVKQQDGILSGSDFSFNIQTDSLKEFVAFYPNGAYTDAVEVGKVANQNLHARNAIDLVILTHPDFLPQANRLAAYHFDRDQLDTLVVTPEMIYNEFSSGSPDVSAIRNFMKMLYDNAEGDSSAMPKYLCLFGDGSYDNKERVSGNTNFILTYQGTNSVNPLSTLSTDDYYGMLDNGEGSNINEPNSDDLLDIGIGRLPVKTLQEAEDMVDKICHCQSSSSFGSWRNMVSFIADDEDGNTHSVDADKVAKIVEDNYPVYNADKIYLDAYNQESAPGGQRYPDVNAAIQSRVFSGTLIMNYTGHGGTNGLAHERILGISEINSFDNFDKLTCWVTATCEFSRYDDPEKLSAGEQLLLNPRGGAIALVTTLRIVYSNANYQLNSAWFNKVFEPYTGRNATLGEVMMMAKNDLIANNQGISNTRKFVLLGDPALSLAYPEYNVTTTFVNDHDITVETDTLKALAKVTIKGEVRDLSNLKMTDFNGVVYPTIYDKTQTVSTLGQDPSSSPMNFDIQKNIVYRGKATVTAGDFEYTFIVPKDISYSFGNAKISYYSDNGVIDAHGFNDSVMIGGTSDNYLDDNIGPEITIYMNDEKFVPGGLTDENPILFVKLSDENGINTVGNAIGHDITSVIDDETKNTKVLNDFYEAALDDYQRGTVTYPMYDIAEGQHIVSVKAWDVYNNSSEEKIDFVVASSASLALDHVLNYPNPFTTKTGFMFEHNRPGDVLRGQIRIFTVAGRLVKTITFSLSGETISGDPCVSEAGVINGYRISDINWDGTDDYGDQLARGVYVYEVEITSGTDGAKANKFEKLVLLK